jgi:hypothetical protein
MAEKLPAIAYQKLNLTGGYNNMDTPILVPHKAAAEVFRTND